MDITRQAVKEAINALAGTDGNRQFQSRLVRKTLKIDAKDRLSTARIHNIMKSMERDGEIEEVPSDRKRNKFFRIRRKFDDSSNPTDVAEIVNKAESRMSAPDRLTRIEQTLQSLEQRVSGIEGALRELLAIWK